MCWLPFPELGAGLQKREPVSVLTTREREPRPPGGAGTGPFQPALFLFTNCPGFDDRIAREVRRPEDECPGSPNVVAGKDDAFRRGAGEGDERIRPLKGAAVADNRAFHVLLTFVQILNDVVKNCQYEGVNFGWAQAVVTGIMDSQGTDLTPEEDHGHSFAGIASGRRTDLPFAEGFVKMSGQNRISLNTKNQSTFYFIITMN